MSILEKKILVQMSKIKYLFVKDFINTRKWILDQTTIYIPVFYFYISIWAIIVIELSFSILHLRVAYCTPFIPHKHILGSLVLDLTLCFTHAPVHLLCAHIHLQLKDNR